MYVPSNRFDFNPSLSGTVVLNQCKVILDQGEYLVDLLKNHKSGQEILPEHLEPLVERAREAVQSAGAILESVDKLNATAKAGNKIPTQKPRELQTAVAGLTRQITVALSGRRTIDEALLRDIEAQLLHVKDALKNVVLSIEAWKVAEGRAERKTRAEEKMGGLQDQAAEIAKDVKEILLLTKGQLNPEEFVGKARETLNKLNALVEFSTDVGLPQEGANLRDATVEFISAATAILKNPESADSEGLNQAVKNVAIQMRALLDAVSALSPKAKLLADRNATLKKSDTKKFKGEGDKNVRMRGQALREMFETENTYLEQLKVLQKDFFEPLKQIDADKHLAKIMELKAVKEVADALPRMIALTQRIRDDLLTAMAAMDPDIGLIFLNYGTDLDCYQHYINNITIVEEKFTKIQKKSHKFDNLVKDFLKTTQAPSLGFFLILPIQRPPRYEMLLKELSKYSTGEALGGENMAAAFKLIGEINAVINQRKKEDENRKLIKGLQKTIKSDEPLKLYQPGRMFIRQGQLDTVKNRKIRKGDKLGKRMHYFMFNDILVQTKPTKGVLRGLTYQYIKTISFEKFSLTDEISDAKSKVENVFTLTEDEDKSQWAALKDKKKKPKPLQIYRFSCQSSEEKTSWMRDIEEAISVNKLMGKVGAASDNIHRGGTVRVNRSKELAKKNK